MSQTTPQLQIATAPFLHRGLSTRRLMWEVLACAAAVVKRVARWIGRKTFRRVPPALASESPTASSGAGVGALSLRAI